MRLKISYKCKGCGLPWFDLQDHKPQLVFRMETANRVFVVPAEVSPCCGHATLNVHTGEQIFLSDEKYAELLKLSKEVSKEESNGTVD